MWWTHLTTKLFLLSTAEGSRRGQQQTSLAAGQEEVGGENRSHLTTRQASVEGVVLDSNTKQISREKIERGLCVFSRV